MPTYGCRVKIGIVGFEENLNIRAFVPRDGDPELNFLSYGVLIAFLLQSLFLPLTVVPS